MGVKATFKQSDVNKYLQQQANEIHNRIVKAFVYAGERCQSEARENKTYRDQTGNLTASIGYVVTYNGRVVAEGGFEKIGGQDSGASGKAEGRSLANQIAQNHTQGYCLIVVAGMNYAYSVEARGLNVLSSAELLAEKILSELLTGLKLR